MERGFSRKLPSCFGWRRAVQCEQTAPQISCLYDRINPTLFHFYFYWISHHKLMHQTVKCDTTAFVPFEEKNKMGYHNMGNLSH